MGRDERSSPHHPTELTVLIGSHAYAWRELLLPSPDDAGEWWHPGLALTSDGTVLAFRQGGRRLLAIPGPGQPVAGEPVAAELVPAERELPVRIGHGITVGEGSDAIWIADPGLHAHIVDGAIVREANAGRVVRVDPRGRITAELEAPPLPVYRHEPCRPTSVAIVADQIWVADGYGRSLVHRYDAEGRHIGSMDGTTRAGSSRFDCPHALFVDPRSSEPLVWVADRGNAVLRAFDADGQLVRTAGAGSLNSPSGIAALGDLLIVAELSGWLAVLDSDGRLVDTLGRSGRSRGEMGWPNDEHDGKPIRPSLSAEAFNSPHAIVSRPDGSLLIGEWLLGGRLVELRPRRPDPSLVGIA